MRIALLAVLLAACTSNDAGSVTRIELGTGMDAFTPLSSGSSIELVHGPQGGWHVVAAVRLWTDNPAGPEDVELLYEARPPAGATLGMTHLRLLDATRFLREGDHWLRLGDLVVLDVTSGADVVGTTLDLCATAEAESESTGVTVVDALP